MKGSWPNQPQSLNLTVSVSRTAVFAVYFNHNMKEERNFIVGFMKLARSCKKTRSFYVPIKSALLLFACIASKHCLSENFSYFVECVNTE